MRSGGKFYGMLILKSDRDHPVALVSIVLFDSIWRKVACRAEISQD